MGGIAQLEIDNESEIEPECRDQETPGLSGSRKRDAESWWSRPCGGRDVIRLALPLMVSTFSYSVMQFCDRMFLSWHSQSSLAAALPAGIMAWTFLAFPFGLALYTNVFVAQYFGAEQKKKIGSVLWHGLILASMSIPLFAFSAIAPKLVFQWAGHEAGLIANEAVYFRYMAIGSIGNIFGAVLTSFFIGQGRTLVVMAIDVAAAGLNILLDFLLIFGFAIGTFSLEPMGIMGAAIATSIALWFKAAVAFLLVMRKKNRETFGLFDKFHFQWSLVWRMLRFGSSNGIQFLVECIGIAAFGLMIGRLGETQAAASTIAININMLVFVPIFGLSMAVSTMVGQQIGKGRPELAARATWTSLQVAVTYTFLFGMSYLLLPKIYMLGFESGKTDFEATAQLVRGLLVFVAAYCIFDSIQIIFVGAIKGAGDTMFVILTTIVCSTLFVVAGFVGQYIVGSTNGQLYWWWATLTGWIVLLCIVFGSRFLQGKWKSMKVIEHTL